MNYMIQSMMIGVRGLEAPSRDENLLRGAGAAAGRLSSVCLSVTTGRVTFWISGPKRLSKRYTCVHSGTRFCVFKISSIPLGFYYI